MGAHDWRFWKIEFGIPPWDGNPLIATMGAASLSEIFTTPPTPTKGDPASLLAFLAHFDFDRDAPKIYAKGTFEVDGKHIDYPESAWEFMTPPDADNPKLEALRAAGHKLIVYQGQSDGVFSFNSIARWDEKLDANAGGKAAEFARLFAVPGMNHCSGGPATDSFDALGAIVDWVEKGKAPDAILASVTRRQQGTAGELEQVAHPAAMPLAEDRPLCRRRRRKGGKLRLPMKAVTVRFRCRRSSLGARNDLPRVELAPVRSSKRKRHFHQMRNIARLHFLNDCGSVMFGGPRAYV